MEYFEDFEAMDREFHTKFKMPEEEKLVCYSSCNYMRNVSNPGVLYSSLNHLCFYSANFGLEKKLCFRYIELVKTERNNTEITISTSRNEKYTFSNVSGDQYDVIVQLSKLTAKKWLQDPHWPFVSDSIIGHLNHECSLLQGLRYLLEEDYYRILFRLPPSEAFIKKCPGNLKLLFVEENLCGEIYLFKNCMCFRCKSNTLVIPLHTIMVSRPELGIS